MYQKVSCKGHLSYSYFKVQLEFESDKKPADIQGPVFKFGITQAVQTLYGDIGASTDLDVLKFDEETLEAVLRVQKCFQTQLWSALTLCGEFRGQKCVFRVQQVSAHLMGLAANSRNLAIPELHP